MSDTDALRDRMSAPSAQGAGRVSTATARYIVWVFLAISVIVCLLTLGFGTAEVVGELASGRTQLTLVADSPLPTLANSGSATIVGGEFSTAAVTLSGLSAATVVLSAIASIAQVLTQAALTAVVALLAWRVLRGGVFRRSVSFALSLAGVILLVGGMLSQGAGSLASGTAAAQLNGSTDTGFWPLAGAFDPSSLVTGIVLLLVSLAFGYGERLQRETEGLV